MLIENRKTLPYIFYLPKDKT